MSGLERTVRTRKSRWNHRTVVPYSTAVRVKFECPMCGGDHSRAEHATIELRLARERALYAAEEAAEALDLHREAQLRELVGRIDQRLGVDAARERRLTLAAEAGLRGAGIYR